MLKSLTRIPLLLALLCSVLLGAASAQTTTYTASTALPTERDVYDRNCNFLLHDTDVARPVTVTVQQNQATGEITSVSFQHSDFQDFIIIILRDAQGRTLRVRFNNVAPGTQTLGPFASLGGAPNYLVNADILMSESSGTCPGTTFRVWSSRGDAIPLTTTCPDAASSSFSASPSSIIVPQGATLSWNVPNALSVTISGVAGTFPASGSVVVTPSSTTTYTLTGAGGGACPPVQLQTTVFVASCQTIGGFGATASTINAGQSTNINYALSGASSATITDLQTGAVTSVPVQSGSLTVSPASTRTYRLTVNGSCAPIAQDLTITVNQPPTINTLSASATSVCAGSNTNLSWTSSGGATATITDLLTGAVTSVPVNGSLLVTPASTRSYRLTVTNGAGSVTQDIAITVTPLAVINSFNPSTSNINSGQSANLVFSVSNTTARSITDLLTGAVTTLPVESGSLTVSPASTRTYRLTASNGCNTVTQDTTITVTNSPVINSFDLNAPSVCADSPATLTWTATGGTTATISAPSLPGSPVAVNPNSGSLVVNPNVTTTYTLTETNAAGSTTAQRTVTVLPAPSIGSLTATSMTVNPGGTTALNYTSSNGSSATITDLLTGAVTSVPVPNGSLNVTPASTRTYRLTVSGTCGSVTRDITITVATCQTVDSFTVNGSTSDTTAVQGSTVTVSYSISNFTSASLTRFENFTPVQTIPLTAASGSFTFTQPSDSSSYTLTVNGSCSSISRQLIVYSTCATAVINSFTSTPPAISPGGTATLSYSVLNAYYVTIRRLSDNVDIYTSSAQTGSIAVTPSSTTTYRIITGTTAGCAFALQDLTVTVNQPPSADTFTATPSNICAGANSTLTFSATNAVSATISAPGLPGSPVTVNPSSGTLVVTPATTTTYTYTVTGAGGQAASKQVTVVVTPLVAINSYSATATSITAGQPTTFNYSTSNATSATITDMVSGTVTNVPVPSGSLTVNPPSSRTYRLTVTSSCGSVTQDIAITVNAVVCQSLDSFTVNGFSSSPQFAEIGSTVTVSYSISNFTSAFLNAFENFTPTQYIQLTAPSGTLTFTQASHSTAYRITVNGACGSYVADLVVYSTCPTVTVNSWTATPPTVASGQPSTLAWDVTNAYYVIVRRLSDNVDIYTANGGAPATGSIVVNPTQTTTYRILAGTANNGCPFAQQDVTVTVDAPSVLIGPAGQPDAVGPTGTDDDYSNMTLTTGVAAPFGGVTTAGGTVTFTNTILNVSAFSQQLTLMATSVPAGFTVEGSLNGGASWVNLGSVGISGTLTANQSRNVLVRITAPAGLSVLTGHSSVLRVSHTNTPSIFNETIDRLYTGFVRADKSQTVTNSTGVGAAGEAVPGAVIEYSVLYQNVTTTSGTGNLNLTATNVVLTEDGNAAPNNWGATTTHVPASASDTLSGTITGDVAGSSLLRDMIPSLAPAQSGTFKFKRVIR